MTSPSLPSLQTSATGLSETVGTSSDACREKCNACWGPCQVTEKRTFARVLARLRRERGFTQEELAFESGYHPKYISLLEQGRYSPSLTAILEFSEVLNISGADRVGRVETMLPGRRHRRKDVSPIR